MLYRLILGLVLVAITGPTQSYFAQQKREKPKPKDFGSSLKKLKWDPDSQQARQVKDDSTSNNGDDVDVVTIETNLVALDVLVLDKQNKPVRGLDANDFKIAEDDTPQQVQHFVPGDNSKVRRSIVLIIDYSGSQFPYIKNSVESAKVLVDKLGPLDSMAIVTDDIEMLTDFTRNKQELKKKLDQLIERNRGKKGLLGFGGANRQFGRSAQYSALMATLREAFDDEDERPIIIFQTDGDEAMYLRNSIITPTVPDNLPPDLKRRVEEQVQQRLKLQRDGMTEFSLDDIYRTVERSRATIYTVIPGIKLLDYPFEEQKRRLQDDDQRHLAEWLSTAPEKVKKAFAAREDERQKLMTPEIWQMRTAEAVKVQSALAAIGPLSGGWTEFLEAPTEADRIYSRILSDINERYIVGYYPTNKVHDGKRRTVKISIAGHPEYTVRGRSSYYPGSLHSN